jgi:hypothetical protein
MKQTEKLAQAIQLLKELNAPEDLVAAVELWGMFVHDDEVKLHNWQALSADGIIEGQVKEIQIPALETHMITVKEA